MTNKLFVNITRTSIILAFVVVVLGAYTRLSDAGLGCPDWPGCYGSIVVPESEGEIDQSNDIYSSRPLEQGKAWKEMIHRYAAGALGLLVLAMAIMAWKNRSQADQQVVIPVLLVGLIIFQALLGMWTVTLLLKPIVVMVHLLGGLTILLLLVWILLKQVNGATAAARTNTNLVPLVALGLLVVYIQISLGGWTSANYAALVCPDLPVCQGRWIPPMDFKEGFVLWRGLGVDYEYGVLDSEARTAIHFSHRVGAIIALLFVGFIAIRALYDTNIKVRSAGWIVLSALLLQFCLGLANIYFLLPIAIAVAHNGVAAFLLASMGNLLFHSRYSFP